MALSLEGLSYTLYVFSAWEWSQIVKAMFLEVSPEELRWRGGDGERGMDMLSGRQGGEEGEQEPLTKQDQKSSHVKY